MKDYLKIYFFKTRPDTRDTFPPTHINLIGTFKIAPVLGKLNGITDAFDYNAVTTHQ